MSMHVPPLGGTPLGPVGSIGRATPRPGFAAAQAAATELPPTVQRDIGQAARRYEELQSMGRELRFRVEEGRDVVVDVCDLNGQVLRTIPSEAALDIVAGGPLS